MSSPQPAIPETAPRRSTASSSTLASTERQDDVLAGAPESSATQTSQTTPDPRHNRRSRTNSRTHGTPDSKRGSLGRSGGFLLASSTKYGSLGRKATKREVAPRQPFEDAHESSNHVAVQHEHINGSSKVNVNVKGDQQAVNGANAPDSELGFVARPDTARTAVMGMVDDTTADPDSRTNRWSEHDTATDFQHSAAIDPAQIVSMALNLSEGRRRHMAGSLVSSPNSRSGARFTSHTSPNVQLTHDYGPGGSLKKHLQDQRRISKHLTTKAEAKMSDHQHRHTSTSAVAAGSSLGMQHHFSVATLSRAEKARNYFKLSSEYHRLLSNLAPIPVRQSQILDQTLDRAGEQTSRRVMDGALIGRAYNPLQTIRNRRTRARSRKPLDPQSDLFSDPSAVRDWVNIVENVAHDASYGAGTKSVLPRYPPKQHDYLYTTAIDGEKDTSIEARKLVRPKLDWSTSPTELLADAYWLEQNDNRTLIEDCHGSRLFSQTFVRDDSRFSLDSGPHESRAVSSEMEKPMDSDVEAEQQIVDRGRLAQNDSTNDSSGRLKHAWHKARRRSPSDSSEISHSESDQRKRASKRKTQQSSDLLSTGPLERYLNSMMEQQSSTSVPQVGDTSETTARPASQNKTVSKDDAVSAEQDQSKADPTTPEVRQKTRRPLLPIPNQAKNSEYLWSPSSPATKDFGSSAMDGSKSHRTKESPIAHKSAKHIFPFGRPNAKHSKRVESGGTNPEDSDKSSRRQSDDLMATRSSMDGSNSFTRGHGLVLNTNFNESANSLATSPSAHINGRPKDSDSAVRRFFKGGMIGLRREGQRNRGTHKEIPEKDPGMTDDTDTDFLHESDTEDTSGTGGGLGHENVKQRVLHSNSRTTKTEFGNSKPQYHIDLPVFRSSQSPPISRPTTPDRESQARHYARSPLRDASSNDIATGKATTLDSLDEIATKHSNSQLDQQQRRLRSESSSHLSSGSQPRDPSQRPNVAVQDAGYGRKISRASASSIQEHDQYLSDKRHPNQRQDRHWSITDTNARTVSIVSRPRGMTTVSAADIARVRTLLVCTGIKAAALARRAQGHQLPDAVKSAQIHELNIHALSDRTSMAAATQKLTSDSTRESSALHDSATTFRNQTVLPLHRSLHELRVAVGESAEQARTAGDEAVGFGALVTGQKTIEVRRVIDQMERFRRKRRRRVRWIRRVGFGLLEWGVLLIMWQVWFVVMIFKTVWGVVLGVVGVGRWALWL